MASHYDSNGPDEMRTWLDNLSCGGGENSLWECEGNAWGDENCSHSEDIGVICDGPIPAMGNGTNGSFNGTNGTSNFTGNVTFDD